MKTPRSFIVLASGFLLAAAAHCKNTSDGGAGGTAGDSASGGETGGGGNNTGGSATAGGSAGNAGGDGVGGGAGTTVAGAGGQGGTAGQPSQVKCDPVPKLKLTLVSRVPVAPFASDEEWMAAPLALVQAKGDDRMFIAQRGGIILIMRNGQIDATPFLDMRASIAQVPWGHRGERGLLNLALHPDFASNGRFYVFYTGGDNDPHSNAIDGDVVVAEGTRSSANPNRANPTLKPLLVLPHGGTYDDGHNGGLLVFGKDGKLWTAVGDGGNGYNFFKTGQDPEHPLAKLYKLDVDNPSANPRAHKDHVWSMGHRNPFRGSIDSATGDLYIGDVHEGHWEEINVVPAATAKGTTNYGWGSTNQTFHPRASCAGQPNCPTVWTQAGMEGSHCFPAFFTDEDTECVKFGVRPFYEYPHPDTGRLSTPRDASAPVSITEAAAVIGGFVYRGSKIAGLQGRYFFGDYPGRWIRSFINMNGKAECVEDHAADLQSTTLLKGGLVGFGQDNTGELYLLDRDQTHLSGGANAGQGRNIYKLEAE